LDYLNYLMSMGDLRQYVGKWIALVGRELVASGDSGKEVFAQAKLKYPNKEPFVMKIPSDTVMLL
jgi:Family of unknown function (DUF5678)